MAAGRRPTDGVRAPDDQAPDDQSAPPTRLPCRTPKLAVQRPPLPTTQSVHKPAKVARLPLTIKRSKIAAYWEVGMRLWILAGLALMATGCETKSDCPDGTKMFGDPPRKGYETICKRQGSGSRWVNHGPKTTWHMTGQKKMQATFVDGREDGVRIEWSEAGKKIAERTFKAGKLDGRSTEWAPDGKKTKETLYANDQRNGIETIYHPTGKKKTEGTYKHDVLRGSLKTWLPDGSALAQIDWVPYELSFYRMGPEAQRTDGDKEVVKPFEISISEVTVAQYRGCVSQKKCTVPGTTPGCNWGVAGRENHPINCVDWAQAKVFARWAKARLPTPGEWEFVARSAGRETPHPWGAEPATCDRTQMKSCGTETVAVCTKSAGHTINGECDLLGNVAEWTAMRKDAPADTRDVRGGSYASDAATLNATRIESIPPKTRAATVGFRVARAASPQ